MIYTYAATVLIAACLAATGAWKVQDWRYNAKEKERAEQQLENERIAAKTAIRRAEAVIEAQNAATKREAQLRADAAAARAAADGLRTSITSALSRADNDLATCTDTAATLGELLGAVEAAGRSMAQAADLHASDARKMMEAWPK